MMPEGSVKTLLLTDLVGSTALVERLGDARASDLFARTDRLARDLFAQFAGREVDKSDGFLALFERPIDAVRFALAYHGALRSLSAECGESVAARAGIHLGKVILKENPAEDVARGAKRLEATGAAVPTCARVMALAQGGQTLLTRGAFDVARTAARGNSAVPDGTDWVAHGPYVLKGIEEPVDVFEAGVRGLAPLAPPPDSEKARRAVAAGDEVTLGWRPAPGLEIEARPNWILKEKLGEGGFGEVWLVEHVKTHERRVYKFCFQADRLRGLKREVVLFRVLKETLGDRDDIAKVIDWNFEAAPFFIESEYTEGGNLLEWAESQGGIANVPLEVRLEVVAQVAEAVGAAHSVGVLHKDIKPSNILVRKGGTAGTAMPEGGTGVPPVHAGERGAPGESGARATTARMPAPPSSPAPRIVLTDFGIGLITDRSVLEAKGITASGMTESVAGDPSSSRTGTRLYMAPELLEGKPATIQSDVYALGIMLYQTLAGDFRRALSSDWREDIGDELLREDIAACLARDTGRRLASAGDVATRLRTLGERREERDRARREKAEAEAAKEALEKARRRRRALLFGALSGYILFVFGLVGLGALRTANVRAEIAKSRAEENERVAVAAREQAELSLKVAQQHGDGAYAGIRNMIGKLRVSLESQLTIDRGIDLQNSNAIAEAVSREVTAPVLDYLLSLNPEGWPRELRDRHAKRLRSAAQDFRGLGLARESLRLTSASLEISLDDTGRDSVETASALHDLGADYRDLGDLETATRLFSEASGTFLARFGEGHPETLSCRSSLAGIFMRKGETERALTMYLEVLRLRKESIGEESLDTAESLNNAGMALMELGRFAEARLCLTKGF